VTYSSRSSGLLYRWTEYTPDALSEARVALRRAAHEYGLPVEQASDAVMAAGEVMANAVEHACGPYELHVRRGARELVCEVVDHDPRIPQELLSAASWNFPHDQRGGGPAESLLDEIDERGRGLRIVHQLSRGAWGVRKCGRTKVVWFSIALCSAGLGQPAQTAVET
jgi:anti-sigma regulatory factor (Ser/Thr protein kinase)